MTPTVIVCAARCPIPPTPSPSSPLSTTPGCIGSCTAWKYLGVVRTVHAFGPRQRPDSDVAVIPIFVDALRSGVSPQIQGDGEQSRDFTYVDDTVTGYLAAARARLPRCAGLYDNIAAGGEHSLLELLAALQRIMLGSGMGPGLVPGVARPV